MAAQAQNDLLPTAAAHSRAAPVFAVLGSRTSALAMWQAREVQRLLAARFASGDAGAFPIVSELAAGDVALHAPLAVLAAASPGLFTKELELALLAGASDIAVHSLKDMPTALPPGLELVGVSAREDARDALVLAARHAGAPAGPRSLADLPAGAVVGTSSVRREALLRAAHPHVRVASVRGNLATRIAKLDAPPPPATGAAAEPPAPAAAAAAAHGGTAGAGAGGGAAAAPAAPGADEPAAAPPAPCYDALLLASAGLARLGWGARATRLDPSDFPYGVGQGALGLEARAGDARAAALARAATHGPTALRCLAERAFLRVLQGGCQVPVGVASWFDDDGEGRGGEEGARPRAAPRARAGGRGGSGGGGGGGDGGGGGAPRAPGAGADAAGDEDGQPERARSLTVRGTVLALDGSVRVDASVTETLMVPEPEEEEEEGGEEGGVTGAPVPGAAAGEPGAARAVGSDAVRTPGLSAARVPTRGRVLSAAQWARLVADGERVGRALAARALRGGAVAVLEPLGLGGPPREATFGSA